MGTINFTKMHGLGNDYLCIDVLKNKDLKEIFSRYNIDALIRYLCNRNFGIGADGVIFLESSKIADFKMRIFNSDGTEAEMCGNGIRCISKFIYDNNLVDNSILNIETLAGIKQIKKEEYFSGPGNQKIDEYIVNMGNPKLLGTYNINVFHQNLKLYSVSIGNPHAVIFVDNVENIDVKKIGSFIENMRYFPKKTNVEFAQVLDKNLIKLRVWERGAGETYACGTGSCATIVAGFSNNFTKRTAKVLLKGGELKINWDEKSNNVFMKGIATKVFDGKIVI